MLATLICLLSFLLAWSSAAVNLKVGLYNEIPDLQGDGLATYKAMVEEGFNSNDHTVDAIVDPAVYSPYGDLKYYLELGGFDLIEIDTANLMDINNLLVNTQTVQLMPSDTMPTAKSAVQVNNQLLGYPTLLCGNFIIGLSPGTECKCPLKDARINSELFTTSIELCEENLLSTPTTYQRLYGGKMNDEDGWYLPYLYMDAYIDINGPVSVTEAVEDVLAGIVDSNVCQNLNWFISQCSNTDHPTINKCYQDFPGSYVESSSNIYTDINNQETMFFFGFSEKTAMVKEASDASVCPYAAISWPLGPSNYMLQFTDALVVNSVTWATADEEKKNAIRDFITYFTGYDLRRKIALGKDLIPPRNRYLLQAIESFYKTVEDNIYQDLYWQLQRSVAAPTLSGSDRSNMQTNLTTYCISSTSSSTSKYEAKTEL